MTRCPVPYALVALLGWGLGDALVALARERYRHLRAHLFGKARAALGGP